MAERGVPDRENTARGVTARGDARGEADGDGLCESTPRGVALRGEAVPGIPGVVGGRPLPLVLIAAMGSFNGGRSGAASAASARFC